MLNSISVFVMFERRFCLFYKTSLCPAHWNLKTKSGEKRLNFSSELLVSTTSVLFCVYNCMNYWLTEWRTTNSEHITIMAVLTDAVAKKISPPTIHRGLLFPPPSTLPSILQHNCHFHFSVQPLPPSLDSFLSAWIHRQCAVCSPFLRGDGAVL